MTDPSSLHHQHIRQTLPAQFHSTIFQDRPNHIVKPQSAESFHQNQVHHQFSRQQPQIVR